MTSSRYLETHSNLAMFHLNTNAVRCPPAEHVKRLKVSLDSSSREYWDGLVGHRGTFDRVVANIREACPKTVVSITYTLTHENYLEASKFAEFAQAEFPGLYAVFFSVYKGKDPRFAITEGDVDRFFTEIVPALKVHLNGESIALLEETLDEKVRLCTGTRFPESDLSEPCWLSLSERVYSWDGSVSACSHLFRDGIRNAPGEKNEKCSYGCNRRLVAFNELVSANLFRTRRGPQ